MSKIEKIFYLKKKVLKFEFILKISTFFILILYIYGKQKVLLFLNLSFIFFMSLNILFFIIIIKEVYKIINPKIILLPFF